MGLLDSLFNRNIDEAIDKYKDKGDAPLTDAQKGEGWEFLPDIPGVGNIGLQSFNVFYKSYINVQYKNELERIKNYRSMARNTEVADVIEDAVNESTQEDADGAVLKLEIKDKELATNENIVNNLHNEFEELFSKRIKANEILWDLIRTFYIDGRVFFEKIIDAKNEKKGLINIKRLPTETMDYIYDPFTGEIQAYFQYLKLDSKKPLTIDEALKRDDVTVFYPEQICFINYGIFGKTRYEIEGYLEKAKIPYNQLKLLETSVIIYRIVRAPERLVFRIDTGNMPRDKALKYVEKIKQKMTKKQTYDPATGQLTQAPEVLCIRKNTEIPLLDGRYLTLEKIIEEHKKGKENWVYTINQKTLDIEPGKIKQAKITRKNEKLIRVWFDDGNYIDTTYDHKFILRDGSECRADKLKKEQSLMPLYKKKERIKSHVKNLYETIYVPSKNKFEYTHNIVSTFFNGKKEKGNVDHHMNFNPFDNSPNNLQRMDYKKHSTMHGKLVKKAWENNYEKMYNSVLKGREKVKNSPEILNSISNKLRKDWEENYETRRKAIADEIKEWHSVNENYKKHSEWTTKTNIEQNKVEKMWEILNTPEIRAKQKIAAKEGQLKRWSNPENKIKMSKIMTEVWRKRKAACVINHKILKIEYLSERDDTGCIEINGNHNFAVSKNSQPLVFIRNSILENYYMPQSADGRGSTIDSIGGNAAGFTELDDIYYFAKKMYRSLKYPASRVAAGQENRDADMMFGGSNTGEISRDEIKWAKFLARNQRKFENEMTDLFLLHLEFKGLKKQYGLNRKKIKASLTPPSNYKEQMEQNFLESRFNNYSTLADRPEMSKYFLMKKFLKWDDQEIKDNVAGRKQDEKYGFNVDDGGGFSDRRLKKEIKYI